MTTKDIYGTFSSWCVDDIPKDFKGVIKLNYIDINRYPRVKHMQFNGDGGVHVIHNYKGSVSYILHTRVGGAGDFIRAWAQSHPNYSPICFSSYREYKDSGATGSLLHPIHIGR